MAIKRFVVYLDKLDPAVGSTLKKTRRCRLMPPDDLNDRVLNSSTREFRY
jgi:mRNA-degrading endonuclease toxin of MazEF toxin-antitoxin module